MTKRRNQNLESVRSFIVSLMNTEQDEHSRLVSLIQSSFVGNTSEAKKTIEILRCVYDAKIDALEKVLKKVEELS